VLNEFRNNPPCLADTYMKVAWTDKPRVNAAPVVLPVANKVGRFIVRLIDTMNFF